MRHVFLSHLLQDTRSLQVEEDCPKPIPVLGKESDDHHYYNHLNDGGSEGSDVVCYVRNPFAVAAGVATPSEGSATVPPHNNIIKITATPRHQ